ncbi:uncharacterized protein LOC144143529 [Haemaphysalis longicornis]
MEEKEDDDETTCRLPMDDMPDLSDGDDVESCGLPMDDMPEDSSEEFADDGRGSGNGEDLDWRSLRAQLGSKLRRLGQTRDGVEADDLVGTSGHCNGHREKVVVKEEVPAERQHVGSERTLTQCTAPSS